MVLATASADRGHRNFCKVEATKLPISDRDSRDVLVLFKAHGNAGAPVRSCAEVSGRLHPNESRANATAAMHKPDSSASLIVRTDG